ncbi:MAG: tRNA (adenosine(37)-N6)-threonylcarbamoyltransferase complex dimerization subunit type 1 TsaB [Bacteroidales bacterium]|nr:tRNA (adenosine(37)-N6)-threonylcarbamoyltransferase complex dimerization subunit type 1 TsaB [Bacteroidales bacterium]
MPLLLLIETSTSACSVALAQGDGVLAIMHLKEPRTQSSLLAPLIQQLLKEQQIEISQCDAIAVSAGPGSYTGLRVGVSTAKGLCFGSGKPLIAIDSLQIMAQNCIDRMEGACLKETTIIPMMDARRMEVYTACYNLNGEKLSATQAVVIDTNSFSAELTHGNIIFTGDGVEKCNSLLTHPNARFVPLTPSADGMRKAAYQAFQSKSFADLAYFEPYYLKEFVAKITCKASPLQPSAAP